MTALAAGNNVEVYIPLEGSMTITPGSGGRVEFGCSSPSAEAPAGRDVYAAAAITIPAGSTVFLRAVGADATYAAPSVSVGAVDSTYTEAQLDAMESGGTLVPDTWYAASDSAIFGLATSASTLARVDFDALALAMENGIATYAAGEIERLAGIPAAVSGLAALVDAAEYARPLVLAMPQDIGIFTQPAATWGTLTGADSGGLQEVSGTGVHGITAASIGRSMYLVVNGVAGFHEIDTVPDTDTITFTSTYVAGAVTTIAVGSYVPAYTVTLPGGLMGPSGTLELRADARMSNTTNVKRFKATVDGTEIARADLTGATTYSIKLESRMRNINAEDAQRNTALYGTVDIPSYELTAIDTAVNTSLVFHYQLNAADEYIRIQGATFIVYPGA